MKNNSMVRGDHAAARTLTILYGSQTGTAQDVAERVAREAKRRRFDILLAPLDDIPASHLLEDGLAIFICATTGQGDPPDNMARFWKFLLRKRLPTNSLCHLNFGVIGLGDSSYQKFNVIGKMLNKRLIQLGATPILAPAFGDEQHDLGHDAVVETWLVDWWRIVMERYPLPPDVDVIPDDVVPPSRFSVRYCTAPRPDDTAVVAADDSSELGNLKFNRQRPFRAKMLANDRLTSDDHFQDVRLVRLDIHGSDLKYDAGDVLMVQPQNTSDRVDEFIETLHLDPALTVTLSQNDPDYILPAVPSPCTVRYLVQHYFDIGCVPRRYFFQLLSFFAEDDLEREKLRHLATAQGQQELFDYCNRPRRTTMEVFQDFPNATSHVTLDYLFDLIPQLQPRAFSIASAQSAHAQEVQLLMAVVKYKSTLYKPRRGVCSTWLSSSRPGSVSVPVWIKPGTISFPSSPETPVIMVGPGTGLAPFRSFIHHRYEAGQGDMMLFFGCRHEDQDYLCRREWEPMIASGRLRVYTAFSRDQDDKVYVQHRLRQHGAVVWQWLCERSASFFIAGNAKNMPDAVREALVWIVESQGAMTTKNAVEYVKCMEKLKRFQIEAWS